jgi:hypothetical protein
LTNQLASKRRQTTVLDLLGRNRFRLNRIAL